MGGSSDSKSPGGESRETSAIRGAKIGSMRTRFAPSVSRNDACPIQVSCAAPLWIKS
jgi:hypothetical protein